MNRSLRVIIAPLALVLVLGTTLGARADVRVLHLSPDTPPVDVLAGLADDAKGELFTDIPFGTVTDYVPVPTGNYFIDVTPADQPDVVAIDIDDLPIDADTFYSVAAIGLLTPGTDEPAIGPLLLIDDAVISDQAQLRIVHAAPDAGEVDVLVNGSTVLEDFAFSDVEDYLSLDPGSYDIEIRDADTDDLLFEISGLGLTSGQVSTAFATGLVSDDSFGLLLTNDFAIPEPSSLALGLLGVAGLAVIGRRRRA